MYTRCSGISANLETGWISANLETIDYSYACSEGNTESVGLFSLLIFFLGQQTGVGGGVAYTSYALWWVRH